MICSHLKYGGFNEELVKKSHEWIVKPGGRDNQFTLCAGETINIPKHLTQIEIGLGWKTRLDLDASVITLAADGSKFDAVSFSKMRSNDGAIVHKGDNRTG